ncbi:antitoxin VbhA family protein [Curtobacterium flaccumfaciens]|uniref:antitoxin VbhA family protein n=1 Tax=Curtobacterium flaccumfaciens TaxID=2035 RepID=UPI00265932A4|nr:antitoxin VbhA family protein [Curtobacterium flaccumfaciens]MCS5521472.1 antitoxin VbhA family protein [Curtobacterium flaccumfaciens pv. oortii]
MTRPEPDSGESASVARIQMIRAAALRLTDPVLRQLLEQVADGAGSASDAVESALNHVDHNRQSDALSGDADRALSLADAALGAEGLQVTDTAVRELGRRVAEGRMTGDEAVAFIDALLPSGVVATQAESQVATLDERTGPFFDAASLPGLLQGSAAALTASVQDGDVLAVVSAEGLLLYPAFQFDETGQPLPRLREVLAQLDPARTDPWGDAVWLNAPDDELDGMSPAAALRDGRADDVIRLAGQAGSFHLG